MANLFVLPPVDASQKVRVDTAPDTVSAATVAFSDGTPVPGALLTADHDGNLPRVTATASTLYLKRLTYHGDVTGTPIAVTGSDQTPGAVGGGTAGSSSINGVPSGITVYSQTSAPSSPVSGDLWFDGTGLAAADIPALPESKITNLTTDLAAKQAIQETVNTQASVTGAYTVPDVTTATVHRLTLTGNATLTFPTAAAGKSFLLVLAQDATGSRLVTWPSMKWQGAAAPTLTTTASRIDLVSVLCADGTNWLGSAVLNFG